MADHLANYAMDHRLSSQVLHPTARDGLARDVFKQNHMVNLRGPMGIGHCCYRIMVVL